MNHVRSLRSLRFESLEARKLLTKTHVAVAHVAPAAVAVPMVLSGTLTVNNKNTTATMNGDGSTTNMTPVAGRLGTIGAVHGSWFESVDQFGNYEGPDEIQLHAPKGTFVVSFNNQSAGQAHPAADGTEYFQHTQRASQGTGAFAHIAETGSIQLITNHGKKLIVSLVLSSSNT